MDLLNIKPPKIALICLLISLILHLVFPLRIIPRLISPFLGTLFSVAGISILLWTLLLFQSKGTVVCPTDIPTVLIKEGPYQYTRRNFQKGIPHLQKQSP